MRALPFCQVDAFSDRPFAGNPAAVVLGEEALSPELMQAIAAENNLSETAFLVERGEEGRPDQWDLRWFTPTTEVELCGHATLGAAVALRHWGLGAPAMGFHTRSGLLTVREAGELLELDLPAVPLGEKLQDPLVSAAIGVAGPMWELRRVHGVRYLLALLPDAEAVRQARPDLRRLGALGVNVVITARAPEGARVDVVSRFFAPAVGVDEDPVTGSAHCSLGPFWAERLGRAALRCEQASARGGLLEVEVAGERVLLRGTGCVVIEGRLRLPT